MVTAQRKQLRIAVMLEQVQLSDIIGIDILGNLSREYLELVLTLDASLAAFRDHAEDMQFYYLATTLEPTDVLLGLKYNPNMTYDECPRDLDLVITGGPLLSHRPPAAERFIREAWPKTRVWITTCFGSVWLADAGVMKGQKATTNRALLETAKKLHPKTQWVDQRWVVDRKPYDGEGKGELWTSGAAGAGIDMIVQFCLQSWDRKFVYTMALDGLEFTPEGTHGQFYATASYGTEVETL